MYIFKVRKPFSRYLSIINNSLSLTQPDFIIVFLAESYKYIAFLKGDIIDPMECSQCHAKFTIDNLSAKRFVKDLERALNDEPFYLGYVYTTIGLL